MGSPGKVAISSLAWSAAASHSALSLSCCSGKGKGGCLGLRQNLLKFLVGLVQADPAAALRHHLHGGCGGLFIPSAQQLGG